MTFRLTLAVLAVVALPHGAPSHGALPRRAELRVPAYTAYLAPDADAARVSLNRPVVPFARAGASIIWFGQFKMTGSITAAVGVHLPVGDSLKLRLSIGGTHHDAMARGGGDETRVVFGAFAIHDTGYVRFDPNVNENGALKTRWGVWLNVAFETNHT